MFCPECNSDNVKIETVQENLGSTTVSKTKSVYKQKRQGLIWWLFIGWWFWIIDLCLWIFLFVPRFCVALFHKRKYKGNSKTVENTVNHIVYKKICVCQNCGNRWKID